MSEVIARATSTFDSSLGHPFEFCGDQILDNGPQGSHELTAAFDSSGTVHGVADSPSEPPAALQP
jgi:hypothetical protein